jgi:hypothetical protein
MEGLRTLYLICAVVGGSALVIQTILLVVTGGVEGDLDDGTGADVDTHHDGHAGDSAFLKWLTIKGIVAFLTFFGLAGLASLSATQPLHTLPIAFGAGIAALFLVGWLMRSLGKLQSEGNVHLVNAVGKTGKVYLRIPHSKTGMGKVHVEVQGRTMECGAVTGDAEIPTGVPVRVVAVTGDVLEVVRAES